MANSFWTEERQARLVELAAEKKTAGEIAMALGCTANAVVGRAYRTDVKLENRAPRKLALANPNGSRDPAPVTLPYVAFLDPKNALPFERLRLVDARR